MRALRAARVFAGSAVEKNWTVSIADDGTIAAVGPQPPAHGEVVDLGDVDLVPGFIDLHSDCLENLAQPRPTAQIPLAAALFDLDALTIANGITTNFLCLGLEDDATKHRYDDRAIETEETLRRLRPLLRADYALHLRVDITADHTAMMRRLAQGGLVRLLSYMDHTPGQGQYASEEDWRNFYKARHGAPDDELTTRLEAKRAGAARAQRMREEVAAFAKELNVGLASHDDDSIESVDLAAALGADFSEFPVSAQAALAAKARGIGTIMGAPNARRGRSHLTNLSARDAMTSGCLDALASDYHPPSMLAAVYAMAHANVCSWTEALALVTSGPAGLARLTDRGTIAPGLRADLVAVAVRAEYPLVVQTWVRGRPALGALAPGAVAESVAS